MKENKKGRNTLYWGVAIVAAIALAVVLFVLKDSIWMALGGAVGFLLAALLFRSFLDMSYFRKLGKQVDAILPLLHEDPDQYIEKLNAIMGEPTSLGLKQSKNINLAAAYCQKGAYRIAADLLEKLDPKLLPPNQKGIYWADYALTQFHLNRKRKAVEILEDRREELSDLRGSAGTGALMAVLEVYRLMALGEKDLAREALAELKDRWPEDTIRREIAQLEKELK